jgi:hypothetical protein
MKAGDLLGALAIVLLGVVGIVFLTLDLVESSFKGGYEQGQIDALNGKWKYELVVKPDTTYIAKPE